MKKQEMQKPLVQSALVLLTALIMIGFVAGSDAHGFFGGITSIVKGLFLSILFIIALAISLAVSVALLIGVFLGAVALYSPDSAKAIFLNLRQKVTGLSGSSLPFTQVSAQEKEETTAQPVPPQNLQDRAVETQAEPPQATSLEPSATELFSTATDKLSKEIDGVSQVVSQLSEQNTALDVSVTDLKSSINDLPVSDIVERTTTLEQYQKELTSQLNDCITQLKQVTATAEEGVAIARRHDNEISSTRTNIDSIALEIDALKQVVKNGHTESTSTGGNHRIFNYIDKEEDKKMFSELIDKAIEENMTYSEIDSFLSQSLPKDVDTVIKEHPALTKQYIRDSKNK